MLKTLNFIRTEKILKQNVKRNSADVSNSVSMSQPSSFVGSKPNRRFFQANEPNRTFHHRHGPQNVLRTDEYSPKQHSTGPQPLRQYQRDRGRLPPVQASGGFNGGGSNVGDHHRWQPAGHNVGYHIQEAAHHTQHVRRVPGNSRPHNG